MPGKGQNRLLGVRTRSLEHFYRIFEERVNEAKYRDIWAVSMDIGGIEAEEIGRDVEELRSLSRFCLEKRLPSMLRIDVGAACSLGPGDWGKLVRSFEVKDVVVGPDPGGDDRTGGSIGLPEDLVTTLRERIERGRRLDRFMGTYYRHNTFLLTLTPGEEKPNGEMMKDALMRLHEAEPDLLRLDIDNIDVNMRNTVQNDLSSLLREKGIPVLIVGNSVEEHSIISDPLVF